MGSSGASWRNAGKLENRTLSTHLQNGVRVAAIYLPTDKLTVFRSEHYGKGAGEKNSIRLHTSPHPNGIPEEHGNGNGHFSDLTRFENGLEWAAVLNLTAAYDSVNRTRWPPG